MFWVKKGIVPLDQVVLLDMLSVTDFPGSASSTASTSTAFFSSRLEVDGI